MTAARQLPLHEEPRSRAATRRGTGRPARARTTTRSAPSRTTTSRTTTSRTTARPARVSPATRGRSSRPVARLFRKGESGSRRRGLLSSMTPVQTALVAGTALVFVLLMGVVSISAQRIEGQRTLDSLQTQLSDLQSTNRELRADVAQAESPEVVLAHAAKLGLVEPGPIVPVEPGPAVPAAPVAGAPAAAAGTGR